MPESSQYFKIRLTPVAERARVWRHLTHYLQRYVPPNAVAVDVGAGYCNFINSVTATQKYAIDLYEDVGNHAAPGITVLVGDAAEQIATIPSGSVDLVFASNFLEHLDRGHIEDFLNAARTALRPGGRLMLLQPNFRRCASEYFDDYTHVSVHSDRSLPDLLRSQGFDVVVVEPGLMPLTMKSRSSKLSFIVPLYLRSPWRPLAKQMLVVAARA